MKTLFWPGRPSSSKVGRTSPASKVASADRKIKGPAHRRAFPLCRIANRSLRRLGLLIDHSFRDLGESSIGLFFLIESLLQKTDSVV
jgi:hypothetical protein